MAYLEGPKRTLRTLKVGYPMDWRNEDDDDDDDYCDFYGNLSAFGCSSMTAWSAPSRVKDSGTPMSRVGRQRGKCLKDAIKAA